MSLKPKDESAWEANIQNKYQELSEAEKKLLKEDIERMLKAAQNIYYHRLDARENYEALGRAFFLRRVDVCLLAKYALEILEL